MFNPTTSTVYATKTKGYVPTLKLRASSFVFFKMSHFLSERLSQFSFLTNFLKRIRMKKSSCFQLETLCHELDDWGDIQTHPISAVIIALIWFYPLHSSQSTRPPTCSLCSLQYLVDSAHSLVYPPNF